MPVSATDLHSLGYYFCYNIGYTDPYAFGSEYSYYSLGNLAGRVYYRSTGSYTWPGSGFAFNIFPGTSPVNEWDAGGAGGGDGSGSSGGGD